VTAAAFICIICVVAQEIHIISRDHKLICPNGFQSFRIYLHHPDGKASLKVGGDETSRSCPSDWQMNLSNFGNY
jgi:hypothetical protein